MGLTLVLGSSAWAAEYKTLNKFKQAGGGGSSPFAGLIFDAAGNLYGTTRYGGTHDHGTVFQLTPNGDGSWTKHTLHSFRHNDGHNPLSSLIFDAAGNLYGTTSEGGAQSEGTVFQLTPNGDGSWTESVLHSFSGSDGANPAAGVIFDAAGNLYGTTSWGGASGCGTVFELMPNGDGSWTESVLHSFNDNECNTPSGLIFDAAGNLYSTTFYGGPHDAGTVFELTPNGDGSWTESVLHSFNGSDGSGLFGGVTFDAAGNLYGTTSWGGGFGHGTVFELTPNGDGSWTEHILHSFGKHDGYNPQCSLIFDAVGNLYGTTNYGGSGSACGTQGCGTVFELTPNGDGSWTESVLHKFKNHPSAYTYAGLVFDQAGNLYGTTYGDGTTTFGSVFEITPNTAAQDSE
jgi:uncharacterized repeat protein (TIGR03803 family)